jgi:hypothetical protein
MADTDVRWLQRLVRGLLGAGSDGTWMAMAQRARTR